MPELHESLYRSFFENSIDAMLLTVPDGTILSANQAACRLLGMTEKEIIKAGRADIVVQDEKLERAIRERERNGTIKAEFTFRRKDGSTFIGEATSSYFTDSVGSIRTSMTIQDITDRKKMEEALVEKEARYRSLFEDNHAPMILIDPSTGEIVDANSAACLYYGYKWDRLTSMRINEINTLDPTKIKDEMERSLNMEKRQFDFSHRLADGQIRDVEVYSGPICINGRPLLYSIIHDVTERKLVEQEVKKRTDELARSNIELQQFAYVASHDLQEPLRMVISYLTLLEKRYGNKLDGEGKQYLDIAVDGGMRMKALIDDLLEYSRVDKQDKDFTPVDMNSVMARTLALLEVPIVNTDTEIKFVPLPTVLADESQMVQVMQNLIGNSIKFHREERPTIVISVSREFGEWVFSVKDNGIGFSMAYSNKIFQMFQRLHTREEYPGTGVGLAIVKKIVERHGGRVWVISEEGKGSTFFFSIPETTA